MKYRLTWVNNNLVPTNIKIYRFDAVPDRTNLGEPLVILTNGETEYVDDLVQGNTYYYIIETYTATARNISGTIQVKAEYRRGPGSTELRLGTDTLGYYGELLQTDVISVQALLDAVGLSSIGTAITIDNNLRWQKFVRNGKILYVPNRSLRYNVSWEQLYNLGLVYGIEGFGPSYPGAGVDQKKIITVGRDQYIVRLPTGADDRTNPTRVIPEFDGTEGEAAGLYCEYADVVAPAIGMPMTNGRVPGINGLYESFAARGTYVKVLCQEYDSVGELALARGLGNTDPSNYHTMNTIGKAVSTACSWQPILELVEV